ncbi:MAG: ATP-binding cassette domain-containing protein [Dermatophilaceae bacterium]
MTMTAATGHSRGFALANVVKGYRTVPVLRRFSLDGGPGVVGIVGPNGAGKTTLLQLLSTATKPTAGTVMLLGTDATDRTTLRALRRRLGVLPQQFGYFPTFTVREFVEYCAWLREVPSHEIRGRAAEAVARVGLQEVAGRTMKTLSGGMLRRAGIAQAVVNGPDLLVLDEPTAGLDPEQRVQFRDLIRAIGASATVVLATHLVEDVAAACDDVAVLADGAVVFRGSPDQLIAQGRADAPGDTPLERGYTSVLSSHHARRESA